VELDGRTDFPCSLIIRELIDDLSPRITEVHRVAIRGEASRIGANVRLDPFDHINMELPFFLELARVEFASGFELSIDATDNKPTNSVASSIIETTVLDARQ